jgi:hypothetical protein
MDDTLPTSKLLADALRKAGFLTLAMRAETNEFHDFFSPHALPDFALHDELAAIIRDDKRSEKERDAAHMMRLRLIDGEFDATKAESDLWAESPEGRAAADLLMKGL